MLVANEGIVKDKRKLTAEAQRGLGDAGTRRNAILLRVAPSPCLRIPFPLCDLCASAVKNFTVP